MAWFFIAIVAVAFLCASSTHPQKRDVFNPAIRRAAEAQVEAADARSDFTLTDKQVEEVREKAFLKESRKNRYDEPGVK